MSRAKAPSGARAVGSGPAGDRGAGTAPGSNSAAVAEEIGVAALALAQRASAAGLTMLGFLLESVALEAGAEAVARRWPAELAER